MLPFEFPHLILIDFRETSCAVDINNSCQYVSSLIGFLLSPIDF